MELTSAALWLNTTFAGFDAAVTTAVHKLYELAPGFFTPFMELISLFGKGGIFLIILSLVLTFFKKTRRFGTAMCLGLAIGALFVNLYLKVVIARPRPYVDQSSVFTSSGPWSGSTSRATKASPPATPTPLSPRCCRCFCWGTSAAAGSRCFSAC